MAIDKKYEEDSQKAAEAEKAWLQSGIDALKNAEKNGYALTGEELGEKVKRLKETDWNTSA